jgi:hypothetical protein
MGYYFYVRNDVDEEGSLGTSWLAMAGSSVGSMKCSAGEFGAFR